MQFEYFVENYRRQCQNIAQRIDFMDMVEWHVAQTRARSRHSSPLRADDTFYNRFPVRPLTAVMLASKLYSQNLNQRAADHAEHIQKPEYPQIFLPVLIHPKQHKKTHAGA